jgi:hypothetical protein
VAGLITHANADADLELACLRNHPAAPSIVSELLSWRDGQVRFWALDAAERVLSPADYIKAMERATRDPYEAVRADAIARLADVAPDRLRPLAQSLATNLDADLPPGDNVFALWTLAKIRAVESVPEVEAFRRT